MKNKLSYKIIWLLVLPILIGQYSCSNKLDVLPKQSIDAGTALTTPENIKATLVGTYLQARDGDIFGSSFNEYSELLAATNDLRFVGTYEQPREFINKAITITNSYIEDTWVEAYELINLCNTLLDPDVLAILDPADAALVEGEAKFLRGWIYFEMARLYGAPYEAGQTNSQLGVPIVTIPTNDVSVAENKPARSTVEQNFAQAIDDLTDAKTLLDPTNGEYASADAASALLARIYLQMGDFANAATEANAVIESGNYSLTATPRQAFNNNENSSEDIFAFQNNIASNTSWLAVMYASLGSGGRGDYEIQPAFLASFDAADLRGEFQDEPEMESSFTIFEVSKMYYFGVGNINNFGGINTSKWGDYYTNLPMFRLAEMYLIRAEANFEAGAQVGPNTPLEDINIIRGRSLAPALAGPITQADIRQERYWELCWEGHRLHDLKRWQLNIGPDAYDAWNLVLPIPRREMEVNENLVQNTGYGTN